MDGSWFLLSCQAVLALVETAPRFGIMFWLRGSASGLLKKSGGGQPRLSPRTVMFRVLAPNGAPADSRCAQAERTMFGTTRKSTSRSIFTGKTWLDGSGTMRPSHEMELP